MELLTLNLHMDKALAFISHLELNRSTKMKNHAIKLIQMK